MQIRQRLTLQFLFVVAMIMLLASVAIYFFSADYRRDDFYTRLSNKATNTAKLLLEFEEVDANLLRRMERDNPASLPLEKIVIYDDPGEILYSSDEEHQLNITQEYLNEIRESGEVRSKQGELEVLGFQFSGPTDKFLVVAGAVDIYGNNKLRNLRTVLILVFAVSMVMVFLLGWIYAGRALQPISRVIDQVDEITISSLNLRVEEGSEEDEITKLARTFNSMLDRLEKAFRMQKSFIANASHELRTPLTTITGQLEVALLNERTKSEYTEIMHSVLEDITNLSTVSNRLLLLAQASAESSEVDFKTVRLDEILWQAAAELQKRNPTYRINVLLDEGIKDDSQLVVLGNEQLLKAVVVNLMDNGCKYSHSQEVEVSLRPLKSEVIMTFRDDGIGIDPQDLPHIFQPFYRGKNTIAIRGHGIGLSLVERIVALHEGQIRVHSMPGSGTTFTLSLPLRHF